jgi:hypothetical protein
LIENLGENRFLVHLNVNALQLGQTRQVLSNQSRELLTLLLTSLAVADLSLVLHAHPELVHLNKIGQDKLHGVLNFATSASVLGSLLGKLILGHFGQVSTEEKTTSRVLNTTAHLNQILQHVLCRSLLGLDVDRSDSDNQVQTGQDVAGVLNQLVELAESLSMLVFQQVKLQTTKLIGSQNI